MAETILIPATESGAVHEKRVPEASVMVIFGASGDLTERKLIPALYYLTRQKRLPNGFSVVGCSKTPYTDDSFREKMRQAVAKYLNLPAANDPVLDAFLSHLHYIADDFGDPAAYTQLKELLTRLDKERGTGGNRLFYLATPPSFFPVIVRHLGDAGLSRPEECRDCWTRIIIEKPFGRDLESARELNEAVTRVFHENQIYRIDHYLGKETVQNILMFRFSNSIFERLWNRDSVDHVQITVAEKAGVGQRGAYYEETGALRDMVQNHLLQVLSLVAMEPPVSLDAEAIRDEKVKLLRSIRPLTVQEVPKHVVRGQYFAGMVEGRPHPGYRQEPNVKADSNTETYVAVKLFIDDWRWSGVPFYLRTGKCLPSGVSEVRIQFRPTPYVLFAAQCGQRLDANSLALRLQPEEGISLRFNGKVPGPSVAVRPVRMQFSYDAEFGAYTPEAYERLLLEAMAGDTTLFIRRDEVETAWRLVDAIRASWAGKPLTNREFYAAGTWGPVAADDLLAQSGHAWHEPVVRNDRAQAVNSNASEPERTPAAMTVA